MWLLGIFYLILGIFIALYGVKLFPYIGASIVAIFTITVVCSLSLAWGWMDETWSMALCITAAFVLGILMGVIMRRNIWLLIAICGLVGGFFGGALIDATIVVSTGWDTVWFYWFISCLMGAIGCVVSCCFGKALVMVSTSGIGSYLFMRSWTLFFPGHYPSEAELMDGSNDFEYDGIFWVFVALFIVLWPLTFLYQRNFTKHHEELQEYEAGSNSNYAAMR